MSNIFCRTLMLAAASLTAVLPARAAVQLEPGLWQDTETDLENGKPAKPEVHTNCMSQEEARDPLKTILKDFEGQKCDALNVKENGSTVTVEAKCGDPKQMRMELDMIIKFITTQHYTGTMKSLVIFRGQRVASERTIDSKWIATSCK
ncbi:MAG TPA: DUF3617 family protein [Burkholderiales bacterium]|nr:DUF3617 family protein [Burkholderiales bacterium]